MSTEKEKENDSKFADMNAARLLLLDFVKKNPQEIVWFLEGLIPFFYSECSIVGLQECMNTVNVTFASIALEVIKSVSKDDDLLNRKYLPVDANQMQSSMYYLSKIIDLMRPVYFFVDKNKDNPAFEMCDKAFSKEELVG